MKKILVLILFLNSQAFGLDLFVNDESFRDLHSWKTSNPSLDPKTQKLTFPRIKVSPIWEGIAPFQRKEYFFFKISEDSLFYAQIVGECVRENIKPSNVYIAKGSIPLKDFENRNPSNAHMWGESFEIAQDLINTTMSYFTKSSKVPDFCTKDFENLITNDFRIANLLNQSFETSDYKIYATPNLIVMKLKLFE